MQQNQPENQMHSIQIQPKDIKIAGQKINSKSQVPAFQNQSKNQRKFSQTQIKPFENQFLIQNQQNISTAVHCVSVTQPNLNNSKVYLPEGNEDSMLNSSSTYKNQFLQSKFKNSYLKNLQKEQQIQVQTQEIYKQIRQYRKNKILQNSHVQEDLKQKAKKFVLRMKKSKEEVLGKITFQKQIEQSRKRRHQQSLQRQKQQKKQLARMRRKIKAQEKVYEFKQRFQQRQKQIQKNIYLRHKRAQTQGASSTMLLDQSQNSSNKNYQNYNNGKVNRQLKSSLQLPRLKRLATEQHLNEQTLMRSKYKQNKQFNNQATLKQNNAYLNSNFNIEIQSPSFKRRHQSIVSPLSRQNRHEIGNKYMIQVQKKRSFSSTNEDCFSIDQKQKINQIRKKIKQLNQMSKNM